MARRMEQGGQPPQAEAPPAEGGQEQSQDGFQGLVTGVHTDMLKIKSVLDKVPNIPDEMKAQLDGVIDAYKNVIVGIAQAAQGGQAPAPEAPAEAPPAPAGPQRVPAGVARG